VIVVLAGFAAMVLLGIAQIAYSSANELRSELPALAASPE